MFRSRDAKRPMSAFPCEAWERGHGRLRMHELGQAARNDNGARALAARAQSQPYEWPRLVHCQVFTLGYAVVAGLPRVRALRVPRSVATGATP